MTTDSIGVYVHIPYCIRKCNYCDFCSLPIGLPSVPDTYIDRLVSEIYEYNSFGEIRASSIYFGGGTPSLLTSEQLSRIVSALKKVFKFEKDTEFTVEANPGTLDFTKLRGYRDIGVNRISLGVQSLIDEELSLLGRIHNADEAYRSVEMIRAAGFDNLNIDLMYGIPCETEESFLSSLRKVIDLKPEHISVYGLIVEEGTTFYCNRDKLSLPTEDRECDMYYAASRLLSLYGYEHYEISNYSLRGKRSRHNLKYWNACEYIGVGASAASYFKGRRYSNTCSVDEYISGKSLEYSSCEPLSKEERMFEYAMMNLRLADGLSLSDYKSRFSADFLCGREEPLGKYSSLSLIEMKGDNIRLTEKGFYLSNTILADLL